MMQCQVYNFSAGPAILPLEVLEQAQRDCLNFNGSGMSVMEMSHRSKAFDGIIKAAEADLRQLLSIPDNYKVMFVQGGASTQFAAIPLNFTQEGECRSGWGADCLATRNHHCAAAAKALCMPNAFKALCMPTRSTQARALRLASIRTPITRNTLSASHVRVCAGDTVDYIVTGAWSKKAYEEAAKFGVNANLVAKGDNKSVPARDSWKLSPDAKYVHYCDNETIGGEQAAQAHASTACVSSASGRKREAAGALASTNSPAALCAATQRRCSRACHLSSCAHVM
jgi:phosphoserine aminotransferase